MVHRFYKHIENSTISYEFTDGHATRIIWMERHDLLDTRTKLMTFLQNKPGFERLLFKTKRHYYIIFESTESAKMAYNEMDGKVLKNAIIRTYFACVEALKNKRLITENFFDIFPETNLRLKVEIDNFQFDEFLKITILKDENNFFQKCPKNMDVDDIYVEDKNQIKDLKKSIDENWINFSIGLTIENNFLELVMAKSNRYILKFIKMKRLLLQF
ncbi:hypothetical protein PVAND_012170 [Polypedilum vanderplanki]|uniref:Uncharacterized protein n=1 Tax=Polypedilum vanderplanki TaxID=319348 RepID=A0A9J6CLM0_POLVA|nr:hypothetical protein PVAND_012170 [Polypedilum vanderplanki]